MTAIALFPLTARQEEIITFMWAFYLENDQLPSTYAIRAHFKFTPSAAADVRRVLCSKGYIELNALHKYRFTPLFHAEQKAAEKADD